MSTNQRNDFQSQFIRLALKRLPHHVLLSLVSKRSSAGLTKWLNSYAEKNFLKNQITRADYPDELVKNYKDTVKHSRLWHGTGRYQYGSDESKVDVLSSIIKSGGLRPSYDAYAIFSGGTDMYSISLTKLRIIARSYADMHGKGYEEPNRYGDAFTWVSYYYGLFYAKLYTLNSIKLRRYWNQWHDLTHDENGDNTWGKKVNMNAKDVWDIFCLGSDILGNYPIVFGIEKIDNHVELSSVFAECETRTPDLLPFRYMTHIEVPEEKIDVTKRLLASHNCNIPVFPIELGEFVASKKTFSDLLGLDGKNGDIKHIHEKNAT